MSVVAHQRAPRKNEMRRTGVWLSIVAAFWIVSDLCYYFLLPALGSPGTYNADPVGTSTLYLFFCGAAVIVFWPVYLTWGSFTRWQSTTNRLVSLALWCAVFGASVGYAGWAVPELSPTIWPEGWGAPPELAVATDHYFLPKALEILFQQLLILALVLALSARGLGLRQLAVACALLFGGMHLLLFFGDMPMIGVVRFIVFSTLFGAFLPWLILRVPNGFAASYAIHFGYYAATLLIMRFFGPGAPLEFLRGLFVG